MNCERFENLMTEYLDRTLEASLVNEFVEHLFSCPSCQRLLDDVQAAVDLCHGMESVEAPARLEEKILEATSAGAMISCSVFDELIADYFEGFITAEDFHVFESHFEDCERCNRLLEGVRAVRELFRQVEPVEVPEGLCQRILDATVGASVPRRPFDWAWIRRHVASLKLALRELAGPLLRPQFVAATILCLAMLGFLLVEFSDDMSLHGIYRQARLRAVRVVERTGDVAAEKERFVLRIEQMKTEVGGLIKSGMELFSDKSEREKPSPKEVDSGK